MKQLVLLFVCIGLLSSCTTNDDLDPLEEKLIGIWKLTEILVDPGDGSGVFEPVNSEKIIEFRKNGVVVSNGMMSSATTESNKPTSLIYSVTESVIFSEGFSSMKFEIVDSFLIINNLCTDPCKSKFVKIQQN